MHTISEAFFAATCAGTWAPTNWKSSLAHFSYKLYTLFTLTVMFLLMLSQLVALCLLTDNMNDFAEAAYVFLTGFNACVKSVTILWRRKRVIDLTDMLLEDACLPQNSQEIELCSYFDKMSRYLVMSCMVLAEFTAGCIAVWPLFFSEEKFALSVRSWHPYEMKEGLTYWCSYIHQSIGLLVMAAWNCTNDLIISSFMIQTCAQLELMSFRLQILPETVKAAIDKHVSTDKLRSFQLMIIRQSVRHHLHIFRFAEKLKSSFAPSIFIQYFLSTGVLCITIYELTVNRSNTAQMMLMLIYLTTMLVELLLYCWFGNEVSLKSLQFSESMVNADWTVLHGDTLKGLMIMMLQTTAPILITCGPFITLSVNSYTSILKLSYSAFNVLQQT